MKVNVDAMSLIIFEKCGYRLTAESGFNELMYGVDAKMSRLLERTARKCQINMSDSFLSELIGLTKLYPNIPIFMNYLTVAYEKRGDLKMAREVNDQILTLHPDYPFGKINHASFLITDGKFEEVPKVLGTSLDIRDMFPERELFHVTEVTVFLYTAIRYLAGIKDLETAEEKLVELDELDIDGSKAEEAEKIVTNLRIQKGLERFQDAKSTAISPEILKQVTKTEKVDGPVFSHSIVYELYEYGLDLPIEVIDQILLLPRETITSDLLSLLQDAVDRYGYFSDPECDAVSFSFPLHAFFLLAEMNDEKILPDLLSFLEHDEVFLDFWFGDHLTETIWQVIFKLGKNQVYTLKSFLVKPGIPTYSKSLVSNSLAEMALHYKEMSQEIETTFAEVFMAFSNAAIADNIIDTDLIGFLITDAIKCNFKGLLPLMEDLNQKGYFSDFVSGDMEEVRTDLENKAGADPGTPVLSIYDLYEIVVSTWSGYNEDENMTPEALYENKEYRHDDRFISQPFVKEVPKIGRNEPCPCGSGKKYKKCCLGNQ